MTDNRSKYSFVLPFLFLAVLLLPMLNSKFDFWHFERSEENRLFTDSLHIDFSHLDEFPKDCESYVNDNFSFRAPLFDLYHSMMFNVFNTSPHPDKTILGKHGWYFTSGKHKECYTGERDFTSDTLDLFLNEWERRSKFMDDRGIKVYWMIAPIKHNIYPEELPFNIVPAKQSRVKQLRAHFKTSLPDLIIDPTSSLINAKKQEKTYYQLDNHWNFRGGKVATDHLLSRIRQDFPEWSFGEVPNFDWNDSIEKSGIHYVVLGMKDRGERREFPSCPNPKSIEDIITEASAGLTDPIENDSDTNVSVSTVNQTNITLPIIKNCDLSICNDSSFSHLSAALGIKTITLMADTPLIYGSYSSKMFPIIPDGEEIVTHNTLGKEKINPQKIFNKIIEIIN